VQADIQSKCKKLKEEGLGGWGENRMRTLYYLRTNTTIHHKNLTGHKEEDAENNLGGKTRKEKLKGGSGGKVLYALKFGVTYSITHVKLAAS